MPGHPRRAAVNVGEAVPGIPTHKQPHGAGEHAPNPSRPNGRATCAPDFAKTVRFVRVR